MKGRPPMRTVVATPANSSAAEVLSSVALRGDCSPLGSAAEIFAAPVSDSHSEAGAAVILTLSDGTPIACACGRYQLCMDGRFRRVIYGEGGAVKLLDLGRKPKPCRVCGQDLAAREARP